MTGKPERMPRSPTPRNSPPWNQWAASWEQFCLQNINMVNHINISQVQTLLGGLTPTTTATTIGIKHLLQSLPRYLFHSTRQGIYNQKKEEEEKNENDRKES